MVECFVSQQNKVEIIKTMSCLQSLAIPSQRQEELSMDFITGLLNSKGRKVIVVVFDRLTKYVIFFSLSHPFIASIVNTSFVEIV